MAKGIAGYGALCAWLLFALGAELSAFGAPPYTIGPEPGWVQPLPLPGSSTVSEEDASEGFYQLLIDRQIRVKPRESYSQFARKIVNEAGVQNASEIHISVNPAYETLELHKVQILRGGEELERLDPATITVLQRETEMERFLLDGRCTVVIRLRDVRPGDVIRYSFTLRGENPVMQGHFFSAFSLGGFAPCELLRHRILAPASLTLHIQEHNTDLKPRIEEQQETRLYEWEVRNAPVVVFEPRIPYWVSVAPWVQVGDMSSWGDVVEWALPLYDFQQALPLDLEKDLDALRALSDEKEKAARALELVQERVRYFGTETGEYSHKPRPPSEVYEQRFGDCKEKVQLLGAILTRLGLSAWPVLVSAEWGRYVERLLPGPFSFDHVILRVRIGGEDYFLDPTMRYQRGTLEARSAADFEWGLTVRSGEQLLTSIRPDESSLPSTEIRESLVLSDLKNESPAVLQVHSTFRGSAASQIRKQLAETGRKELQESYRRFQAESFPSVQTAGPLRLEDDAAANIVQTWEEYRIPNFWKPIAGRDAVVATIYPFELDGHLKNLGSSTRKYPFEIFHPVDLSITTKLYFPVPWTVSPSVKTENNDWFRFSYEVSGQGHDVTVRTTYRTQRDSVPPEDFHRYHQAVLRALEGLGLDFSYDFAVTKSSVGDWLGLWPLLLTAFLAFLLAAIAASFIWRAGRGQPPLFCPAGTEHLDGLQGWLILVGLGVVVRPLISLGGFAACLAPFVSDPVLWGAFTSPNGAFYSPWWMPIFAIETAANAVFCVFGLLQALLFFKKRRAFPLVFAGLMAGVIVFSLADTALIGLVATDQLPAEMKESFKAQSAEGGRALIGGLIWIPYIFLSRRVKATFRR